MCNLLCEVSLGLQKPCVVKVLSYHTLLSFTYISPVCRRGRQVAYREYYLRHDRPSAGMEELSFRWTDFREILYFGVLPKCAEKTEVLLKSDKNNKNLT